MANEKRLIDANALLRETDDRLEALAVSQKDEWREGQYDECFNALIRIKLAPTVDAVEVVRCKDCRLVKKILGDCFCSLTGMPMEADGFCSLGERKDND